MISVAAIVAPMVIATPLLPSSSMSLTPPIMRRVAKSKFKEVLKVASGKVKATGYAAGTSHITVADLAMLASYRCS